jgi:hypothetical protein
VSLVLKDAESAPVIGLHVTDHGHSTIELDGTVNKAPRLALAVDNHGPRVTMRPPNEQGGIELACSSETQSEQADTVMISLSDSAGGTGALLGLTPGGAAYQMLHGPGKRSYRATTNAGDGPSLQLTGADGEAVFERK